MDLTEGGIRVPWIAHWPALIAAGGVSAQLCMTMDWSATMLAAGGVARSGLSARRRLAAAGAARAGAHVRAAALLAHEPPRPARAAPRGVEVPARSTATTTCSTSTPTSASAPIARRASRRGLAAMRADWEAWNASDAADPRRRDREPRLRREGHAAALSGAEIRVDAADPHDLERFVAAQAPVWAQVRAELASGLKRSHWMWFVFPQLRGLGRSAMAERYGIGSRAEAVAYLAHPVLGARLVECTALMLCAPRRQARSDPRLARRRQVPLVDDALRRRPGRRPPFAAALERYFDGVRDPATLGCSAA